MRRFALSSLRDFGMGRKASEDKITEECHYLIQVLKEFKGKVLIIFWALNGIYFVLAILTHLKTNVSKPEEILQ